MRGTRLVRLYPRRWRRRYEGEFRALLEEERGSAPLLLDILSGAIKAHRNPYPTAEEQPVTRRIPTLAATVAAFLVLPALVFLVADAIFAWFTRLHDGSVLLWAAPALALALGMVALWRRLASDPELQADLVTFGAVSGRLVQRPAVVVGAFSVLASLGVLTFVVVHAIAG